MAETEEDDPRDWIRGDESARTMLSRVLSRRPFVLLPPLHRVPLRVGNVVEIAGPSPSAKSQVLLQAAVECVLPKEWKGIHFGGLERIVVYFDLDCRFDVLRLAQILQNRIRQILEFAVTYSRCNIGAFYWMDRAPPSAAFGDFRGNSQPFQNLMETMVQEMRRLLALQPMLVLTTKSSIFGVGASMNSQRTSGKWPANDPSQASSLEAEKISYSEYMPKIWQTFVTHRVHFKFSDNVTSSGEKVVFPVYTSEWVQPLLNIKDKFTVTDDGIILSM